MGRPVWWPPASEGGGDPWEELFHYDSATLAALGDLTKAPSVEINGDTWDVEDSAGSTMQGGAGGLHITAASGKLPGLAIDIGDVDGGAGANDRYVFAWSLDSLPAGGNFEAVRGGFKDSVSSAAGSNPLACIGFNGSWRRLYLKGGGLFSWPAPTITDIACSVLLDVRQAYAWLRYNPTTIEAPEEGVGATVGLTLNSAAGPSMGDVGAAAISVATGRIELHVNPKQSADSDNFVISDMRAWVQRAQS